MLFASLFLFLGRSQRGLDFFEKFEAFLGTHNLVKCRLLIELLLLSLFDLLLYSCLLQLLFGHLHESIELAISLQHVNVFVHLALGFHATSVTSTTSFCALRSYADSVFDLNERVHNLKVVLGCFASWPRRYRSRVLAFLHVLYWQIV